MKLSEIALKIDKSEQNEVWIDTNELGQLFNIEVPWAEQERIKSYWIGTWLCTDTCVGYKMYFFDDKPVAFSIQTARKNDENFKWFSKELADEVRNYLLTLVEEDDSFNVEVWDIDGDIGESYKVHFNSQIIQSDKATLNGEKIKVLERIKNHPYGIDTELKIELSNGEIKHVEVKDLDFVFNLTEV